jgi:uncharacterized protein involved in exopolysaccharide biosynthesis
MKNYEYDEINALTIRTLLREMYKISLGDKKLSIITFISASLIGLAVALTSTKEYTAEVKLLPTRNSSPGLSLPGLGTIAGLRNQGYGGVEPVIGTEAYPEIIKGKEFLAQVAETPVHFSKETKPLSPLKYLSETRNTNPISRTKAASKRIWHAINGRQTLSRKDAGESETLGNDSIVKFNPAYIAAIDNFGKRIHFAVEESGIITLSATMPDPIAAAELAKESMKLLVQTIANFESHKAAEELSFAVQLKREARSRLEKQEAALAEFTERNRTLGSAMGKLTEAKLAREVSFAFEMYQNASQQVETAQMKVRKDTPVFTIVEKVIVPVSPSSPGKRITLLLYMLGGIGIIILRYTFIFFVRESNHPAQESKNA